MFSPCGVLICFLQRPIVFTCVGEDDVRFEQAREMLEACGGTVVAARETVDGRCDIVDCLRTLKSHFGVEQLLVEGGARILQVGVYVPPNTHLYSDSSNANSTP